MSAQFHLPRSNSRQADSESEDQLPTESDSAAPLKLGALSDAVEADATTINIDANPSDGQERHETQDVSSRKRFLLRAVAAVVISAMLLVQLCLSIYNFSNINQMKLHLTRTQTPAQVTQPRTPSPMLHQVQLASFILDPQSAPNCHGDKPVTHPCWDRRKYITSGSLGSLVSSDEDGEGRLGFELTSNLTEIRVLRDGTFAIDAQAQVRIYSGIPSISGGIRVNGDLKLACGQTLPVSGSARHHGLTLSCRVNSFVRLRAGNTVRMVIEPHHPLEILESSLATYIRILRLG